MFKFSNIVADYYHGYSPSTANNGGGYWQPYGTCSVTLEDGTVLQAEFEDTSCGDFGERWFLEFTHEGDRYLFHEDFVGTDDELVEYNYERNNKTWERMFQRFGINADELMAQVARAISDAAMDKYYEEEEEEEEE